MYDKNHTRPIKILSRRKRRKASRIVLPEYIVQECEQIILGIATYLHMIRGGGKGREFGIGLLLQAVETGDDTLVGGEIINPVLCSPNNNCILFFEEFYESLYIVFYEGEKYQSIEISQVAKFLQLKKQKSGVEYETWSEISLRLEEMRESVTKIFNQIVETRGIH